MCLSEAVEHFYAVIQDPGRTTSQSLLSFEFASSGTSTVDLPPYLYLIWLYGCSEDIR